MTRRLDVCIVNYGSPETLARCLKAVEAHLPGEQVRVWDNRSAASPRIRELARAHPDVDWTFSEEGIGFAAGANRLVARSDRDTLLLNPDAELTGPLRRSRAALAGRRVAAVSPTVVDPAGRARPWDVAHRRQNVARVLLNHAGYAGRLRGTPLSDLYATAPSRVSGYITGCSLLVARAAWDDVGPLDERFFVYGEDPDWQRRARGRGWEVLLVDEPEVRHGDEPGEAAATVTAEPATRMEDLRAANTAIALGFRGGRGPGALLVAGDLVLDRVQRSKRATRAEIRRVVRDRAGGLPDIVLTNPRLDPGPEAADRVRLANGLAELGHPVAVVCLEGLGDLQRELDPRVHLLLRPWWLPSSDGYGESAVLLSGASPVELRFGAAWAAVGRVRGNRRWLLAAPAGAVQAAAGRAPLALCDGVVVPAATPAAGLPGTVHEAEPGDAAAHSAAAVRAVTAGRGATAR